MYDNFYFDVYDECKLRYDDYFSMTLLTGFIVKSWDASPIHIEEY